MHNSAPLSDTATDDPSNCASLGNATTAGDGSYKCETPATTEIEARASTGEISFGTLTPSNSEKSMPMNFQTLAGRHNDLDRQRWSEYLVGLVKTMEDDLEEKLRKSLRGHEPSEALVKSMEDDLEEKLRKSLRDSEASVAFKEMQEALHAQTEEFMKLSSRLTALEDGYGELCRDTSVLRDNLYEALQLLEAFAISGETQVNEAAKESSQQLGKLRSIDRLCFRIDNVERRLAHLGCFEDIDPHFGSNDGVRANQRNTQESQAYSNNTHTKPDLQMACRQLFAKISKEMRVAEGSQGALKRNALQSRGQYASNSSGSPGAQRRTSQECPLSPRTHADSPSALSSAARPGGSVQLPTAFQSSMASNQRAPVPLSAIYSAAQSNMTADAVLANANEACHSSRRVHPEANQAMSMHPASMRVSLRRASSSQVLEHTAWRNMANGNPPINSAASPTEAFQNSPREGYHRSGSPLIRRVSDRSAEVSNTVPQPGMPRSGNMGKLPLHFANS